MRPLLRTHSTRVDTHYGDALTEKGSNNFFQVSINFAPTYLVSSKQEGALMVALFGDL